MTKTVIIRGARREMDAGSLGFVLPPWLSRNSCVVRAALRNTSAGRACRAYRAADCSVRPRCVLADAVSAALFDVGRARAAPSAVLLNRRKACA